MEETDLLLSVAEIAGVFVGFGALIAVRAGGATGAMEVSYMRAVVWMGLMTVIAGLTPVTLDRFDLSDRQVWWLSNVMVVIGYWGMALFSNVTVELREARRALSRRFRLAEAAGTLLIAVPMIGAQAAILLGFAPDLDPALYFATVVLILLGTAQTLLSLVYVRRGA
jgi:hypothetical protein